jgi:methyltransferase (TIGR00027 family)|tara:strand:- start:2630 stop:3613 length:984 start_codon:yes stop_codon:yes gene_type:complete
MIKLSQYLTYGILQLLFLPVSVLGAFYAFQKEKYISKKLNISYTAGQVIQGQWILHFFGIREDKKIIKFIKNFPAESHIGFYMMMLPAIIANKITGFTPTALVKKNLKKISSYSFLFFRTMKFDSIISQNINFVDQLVIIGAGFDLRANSIKNSNIKIFELDKKNTQDLKIKTLQKAKIYDNNITYINCDLNNKNWSDDLINNGFDKSEKTLFLFESVSCYLEKEIVENTFEQISSISVKGSLLAQDFYSTKFLHGSEFRRVKKGKELIKKFGENWKFTLDMSKDIKEELKLLFNTNNLVEKELFICGKNSTKSKEPFYAISLAKTI